MNILVVIGKIIAGLATIIALIILIWKLVAQFPNLDPTILLYTFLFLAVLVIIVMPEIEEVNIFGSGFKKSKKESQPPHYEIYPADFTVDIDSENEEVNITNNKENL